VEVKVTRQFYLLTAVKGGFTGVQDEMETKRKDFVGETALSGLHKG
jgi:hypothetical protein